MTFEHRFDHEHPDTTHEHPEIPQVPGTHEDPGVARQPEIQPSPPQPEQPPPQSPPSGPELPQGPAGDSGTEIPEEASQYGEWVRQDTAFDSPIDVGAHGAQGSMSLLH